MQQRIPQKLRILRFVAEQTVVSAQEINRYFFTDDRTNLVVSTLYQLGLARMKFGLVSGGLWYIDDPQLYLLLNNSFPNQSFKFRPVSFAYARHFIEITRIRIALEKSKQINVLLWLSQSCIYAIPPKQRLGICPDVVPDAIFWRWKKDGSQVKYFIHCVRNLNSTDKRYREVLEGYRLREDTKDGNILFLCGNKDIVRRLLTIVKRAEISEGHFKFILLEEFYKHYELASTVAEEQRAEEIVTV